MNKAQQVQRHQRIRQAHNDAHVLTDELHKLLDSSFEIDRGDTELRITAADGKIYEVSVRQTFTGNKADYCYDQTCESGYGYHNDASGNCKYCGRQGMGHWNAPRGR